MSRIAPRRGFKSKKAEVPRFRIPQRVKVVGNRVQVPKVGRVRLRLSQSIMGTTICTEDLSVKGLARTKRAKSVQDAGMGTRVWQLAYEGQWYGTHVVAVDRFYPSTQLCHDCGFKNDALTLAERTWVCPARGVLHDRDRNAALNIRV